MILIFLHYLILMSPSLFLLFPLCFHLLLHQGFLLAKLVLFNLNLFLMLLINLYLRLLTFFLQTLLLIIYKILHNHCSIFLKKLKRNFICKSVMLFQYIATGVVSQTLVYHCKLCSCCECLCYKFCHFSKAYP